MKKDNISKSQIYSKQSREPLEYIINDCAKRIDAWLVGFYCTVIPNSLLKYKSIDSVLDMEFLEVRVRDVDIVLNELHSLEIPFIFCFCGESYYDWQFSYSKNAYYVKITDVNGYQNIQTNEYEEFNINKVHIQNAI